MLAQCLQLKPFIPAALRRTNGGQLLHGLQPQQRRNTTIAAHVDAYELKGDQLPCYTLPNGVTVR